MEYLASATATAEIAGNLSRCNPFISASDAGGITCCTMLLMMSVNRINHANLALQQARGVLKLLKGLQRSGLDATAAARIKKELLSLSENLAATLANRRHYAKELSAGVFEIDPRFLLFEFSHGLLLRLSQVQLIHQLLSDMAGGKSVCHQMIMGAGKTTVVGPLVAMLVASSKTMVSPVHVKGLSRRVCCRCAIRRDQLSVRNSAPLDFVRCAHHCLVYCCTGVRGGTPGAVGLLGRRAARALQRRHPQARVHLQL